MADFSTNEPLFGPRVDNRSWDADHHNKNRRYDIFSRSSFNSFYELTGLEKNISLEFSLYRVLNSWSFHNTQLPSST